MIKKVLLIAKHAHPTQNLTIIQRVVTTSVTARKSISIDRLVNALNVISDSIQMIKTKDAVLVLTKTVLIAFLRQEITLE
jgi:hypothetical protein